MSRKVLQTAAKIDFEKVELQLALQCAPLLSGLKISNLLIIDKEQFETIIYILSATDISVSFLACKENKVFSLLYKKKELKEYLLKKRIYPMLKEIGYESTNAEESLNTLSERYCSYMEKKSGFPHEIGLFLGYPIEDVEGFIRNHGKNYLCTGYWKVYKNKSEKIKLFQKFDYVRELMVLLICHGEEILDIIDIFNWNAQQDV